MAVAPISIRIMPDNGGADLCTRVCRGRVVAPSAASLTATTAPMIEKIGRERVAGERLTRGGPLGAARRSCVR